MRILVFNVGYSPNLGDGLLSECLQCELRQAGDVTVEMRDLAGRRAYGEGGEHRQLALRVLSWLPAALRQRAVELVLSRKIARDLRPYWRQSLEKADAMVIGGGNLFADADLNFPLKIEAALKVAAEVGVPVAVHAVGVSDNWSARGTRLFREGLAAARVVRVRVRDEASRQVWLKRVPAQTAPAPDLALDPGLLTARHFPARERQSGGRNVALGVVHPITLKYHAMGTDISGAMQASMTAIAGELVRRGLRVTLFTNGSPEDRHFLATLAPGLIASHRDAVSIAPRFATPSDLAGLISSHDLVIAHRMHACIAAYAYGVPCVGLAWDPKLQSFFDLTGRHDFVADPERLPAAALADLAERALAEGIDAAQRDRLEREAAAGIHDLAASLRGACAPAKS